MYFGRSRPYDREEAMLRAGLKQLAGTWLAGASNHVSKHLSAALHYTTSRFISVVAFTIDMRPPQVCA